MALWAALLVSGAVASADDVCAPAVRSDARALVGKVQARQLAQLRDMGSSAAWAGSPSPFSLSPDRRFLAVQLTRADPDRNDYCHALAIMRLESGELRILDRWRGFLRQAYRHGGRIEGFENGVMRATRPRWSPDGRSLLYVKPGDDGARLWHVDAGGGAPSRLPSPSDVLDALWLGPSRIIVSDASPTAMAREAIEAEGKTGHLYDDRFFPLRSSRPFPRAPVAPRLSALEVPEGEVARAVAHPASASDIAAYEALTRSTLDGGVREQAGLKAWLGEASGQLRPYAALGGETRICGLAQCSDVIELQPLGRSKAVVFLRREGWAKAEFGFYRWDVGTNTVRRLHATRDFLLGCVPGPDRWICARETATRPRHLVSLNPASGDIKIIFDPNPDFPRVDPDRVRRIKVMSPAGAEAYADLVLPAGYRAGERYPAVVVQYESRGFLRGGTGDEYPILALADQGFAVLSVQRPADYAGLGDNPARDRREYHRRNTEGWSDRRHALAALLATLDHPRVRAVIDPARVGITGLSDGVGTLLFGLLNTDRFAAAIMSSCCEEAVNVMTLMGPAFADDYLYAGFPRLDRPSSGFWAPYSLKENAARVRTPILMQMADREYGLALESYEALRQAGAPVELFVFPDEYHVKWQPAHRLAIYERGMRWLNFWLKGEQSGDPRLAGELTRWRAMRRQRASRSASPAHPGLGVGEVQQPQRIDTGWRPEILEQPGDSGPVDQPLRGEPAIAEPLLEQAPIALDQESDKSIGPALPAAREDLGRQPAGKGEPRHRPVAAAGTPLP